MTEQTICHSAYSTFCCLCNVKGIHSKQTALQEGNVSAYGAIVRAQSETSKFHSCASNKHCVHELHVVEHQQAHCRSMVLALHNICSVLITNTLAHVSLLDLCGYGGRRCAIELDSALFHIAG